MLVILTMLVLLAPVPIARASAQPTRDTSPLPVEEPALVEDFNDNYIDPYVWDVVSTGYGGSIDETGQELRLSLAADSYGDYFGIGIRSKFKLRGASTSEYGIS